MTSTPWKYQNKKVSTLKDIPTCCPFMVYKITFSDGSFYIGSKQIYTKRKVKLSKKRALEQYKGKGRLPTKEIQIKESDWKTYQSSSTVVKTKLKKYTATFEILHFFETKQEMLLQEAAYIIQHFLTRTPEILNHWVYIKTYKENGKTSE